MNVVDWDVEHRIPRVEVVKAVKQPSGDGAVEKSGTRVFQKFLDHRSTGWRPGNGLLAGGSA